MQINNQINMTEHVKNVMESTFSIIDEIASATGVFRCGNLSEITRLELFQFIAYLSASDGVVDQDEIDFLNLIFAECWTPDTLVVYLKNNAIRNGGFEKMIPFTLEVLVQVDATLSGQKSSWRVNLSEFFLSLYKLLGEVFIETVLHAEKRASADLLTYVSFLHSFILENSSSSYSASDEHKEDDIVDICFQSKDFIIPAKKDNLGIIAPRKL